MTRKEIKFTDIVQMVIDDAVPEGATFLTPAVEGSSALITAEVLDATLCWGDHYVAEKESSAVPLSRYVINDTWYIEVPEVELSLEEAIAEWKAGKAVEVKFEDESCLLYSWTAFVDIWDETPLGDLEDLLFESKFYKVAA